MGRSAQMNEWMGFGLDQCCKSRARQFHFFFIFSALGIGFCNVFVFPIGKNLKFAYKLALNIGIGHASAFIEFETLPAVLWHWPPFGSKVVKLQCFSHFSPPFPWITLPDHKIQKCFYGFAGTSASVRPLIPTNLAIPIPMASLLVIWPQNEANRTNLGKRAFGPCLAHLGPKDAPVRKEAILSCHKHPGQKNWNECTETRKMHDDKNCFQTNKAEKHDFAKACRRNH